MRLTRWLTVGLATVGLAFGLAGCGVKPPADKPGKVAKPETEHSTSDIVNGTKGEIVKPPVRPTPPVSPEEEAVAKLNTAEMVAELGKPHARDVASKLLLAKGPEVVPELVKALEHENWEVRAGAVFTLGRLGKAAAPALPNLKKLLETETNETVKDSIPYNIDAIEEQ